MKIVLVITTYAKNYASTNCQSLDSADPKLPLCPPPQQKSNPTRHKPGTIVTRRSIGPRGHIPVQGWFNIDRITEVISMLTVRLLERGTWKNIVQSQRFLKTKDSQVIFLANGPIKFKIQLFNRLKL